MSEMWFLNFNLLFLRQDGAIIIRGFDPVAFQRAEQVVDVASDISEDEFEKIVLSQVTQLIMS